MHIIRRRRNINSPATGGKHKAQPGRDESPDQYEMTLVSPATEHDQNSRQRESRRDRPATQSHRKKGDSNHVC